MTAFIGRDLELTKLKELSRLNVPSLVVIKGRRRVGKKAGGASCRSTLCFMSIMIDNHNISRVKFRSCNCLSSTARRN